MDSLNTKPILDLILSDAREAADKLITQARDRANTISEYASRRAEEHLEQTRQQAQVEAIALEDRMRRMAMLEQRKELVTQKRALIDQAFDQALAQLNESPTDQLGTFMFDLLIQLANGDERLQAGALNDGFFTPGFVASVNQRLQELGKPGQLQAEDARIPGVCGLLLKGKASMVNCTLSALMDARREELEAGVASILFPAPAKKGG